ncbi:MAG: DUF192 domain-containing protein [Thermoanaerobaculia bacterium]
MPVARSVIDRARGLIGRPADRAMIFIPRCSSIHTCFLSTSIDVVFVDGDNRIVAIEASTPPWRVRIGPRGTRSVLELPAGAAARAGLALADTIVVGS